ncbi:MAG: glycosyltransferase family 9 protein [Ignavibacteriaceae bacterium]|nr:glycosyltransferase family 9 protein [Ignavibacteriaceae bacterium]
MFRSKRKGHVVEAEQHLISFISGGNDIIPPRLITSIDEVDRAEKILNNHKLSGKKLAVIQSSCSELNSIRQLSHQKLALIADRLCDEFGLHILFPGTKSEADEIEKIRTLMKNNSISLAGKTSVRDLIAIIRQTKIVIGPDTGTLHVANAVGVPVIMYTGWAIPEDTGPFDLSGRSKVIKANLECIPCKYVEPKPANWEYCKINRPTLCMDKIEVDEIIEAAKNILSNC